MMDYVMTTGNFDIYNNIKFFAFFNDNTTDDVSQK
jgi:hypothetical protein